MASKLLTSLLALIIALPMCWCCVAREVSSAAQPGKIAGGCPRCHMQQQTSQGEPASNPGHKTCPCARGMEKRDLASHEVILPRPVESLLSGITHVWVWANPFSSHFSPNFKASGQHVFDHGPPRYPGIALFKRHHSLLI